jgi:agmatine/peptidylarginine deiminase
MARFIDSNTILLNDFSLESKTYKNKLFKSIKNAKLETICLNYSDKFKQKYKWGAHLNFLDLGDVLFVPIYGIKEDESILSQIKDIYQNKKIETILMPEIIENGGALHCITCLEKYALK